MKGAGPGRQTDGLWAHSASRRLFEVFLLPCVSTGPVYDTRVMKVYARVHFRMFSFSLALSLFGAGVQAEAEAGAEVSAQAPRLWRDI